MTNTLYITTTVLWLAALYEISSEQTIDTLVSTVRAMLTF